MELPSGDQTGDAWDSPGTFVAGTTRIPGPPVTGATHSSSPAASGLNQATLVPSGESAKVTDVVASSTRARRWTGFPSPSRITRKADPS